jgi:hypothetical protein
MLYKSSTPFTNQLGLYKISIEIKRNIVCKFLIESKGKQSYKNPFHK